MLKPSPSRGHKSKSIKVKHVLQICVLLAVCFWLIYQVKHSQEKRREFNAKGENVVDKVQTENEILRFGRKDIPKVTEIATVGDKHIEDDDEKDAEEEEENKPEEEEVKHGEDEQEREDETDENELESKETEHEHEHGEEDDEEDTDENRVENEEKGFPGKEEHFEADENEEIRDVETEDHNEKDVVSDDHEAREEQYKADDASSEVAHHVHNIIPETVNVSTSQANDMFGKVDVGHENETKSSDNLDALTKTEVEPRKLSYRNSNGTVIDHNKYGNNLTKSDGDERRNSTSAILPKSQPSTTSNSTFLDGEQPALSSNEVQTLSIADVSQNATGEGSPSDKVPNFEAAKDKEDAGGIQHDPIDESDTNVAGEENESRLDLDTLPDTKSEGQNAEEAMAE